MQREDLAKKLIEQASDKLRNIYNQGAIVKEKKDTEGNVVTFADKEIEKFLVEGIKEYFPYDEIIAEEGSANVSVSRSEIERFVWFIDPIDGTRNFVSGIPFFGISIAMAQGNVIRFGVISEPMQNNIIYAAKGQGAFVNDMRIKVGAESEISNNLVVLSFVGPKNRSKISMLIKELVRTRVLGSAALNLCLVARGKAIANIGLGLHSWDIAAGILIVEEAGGKVTNEYGEPINIFQDNPINIIATNGVVHDKIIQELNNKVE